MAEAGASSAVIREAVFERSCAEVSAGAGRRPNGSGLMAGAGERKAVLEADVESARGAIREAVFKGEQRGDQRRNGALAERQRAHGWLWRTQEVLEAENASVVIREAVLARSGAGISGQAGRRTNAHGWR
jgi:hypothetical protein